VAKTQSVLAITRSRSDDDIDPLSYPFFDYFGCSR